MTEEVKTDVNVGVDMQTTEPESSTAEPNNAGMEDAFMAGLSAGESEEAETDGEAADESSDDSEEAAERETTTDETTEPQRKNAETRKQQLNNEIRDKVAERNALREEIAELNRQKYQLKSADDLPTVEALMEQVNPETNDYYTRTEAKLARIEAERKLEKEQRELDEYTESIVNNRIRLKDEASQALKDFPIFDAQSDSYNEDLAKQADKIAGSLIMKDEKTGEIIGSHGSLYDVYAAIATAAKSAEASGKIAGKKAAEKMMNSADVVGSSGSSTTSSDDDPFLKGLERG